MSASEEVPIVSSDAGDKIALLDPNSPASIAKRAKDQAAQSGMDTMYDPMPPPREGYTDIQASPYSDRLITEFTVIPYTETVLTARETIAATLVTTAVLLILYAIAPNPQ